MRPVWRPIGLVIQSQSAHSGSHAHRHAGPADRPARAGPAARHLGDARANRRTPRSRPGSGCWSSTAGCRSASGSHRSASWPPPSAAAGPPPPSAYDLLRESGYAASRQGSGTWTTLPGDAGDVPAWAPEPAPAGVLDLAHAAPSAPPQLHAAYAAALDELPRYLPGTGYDYRGVPALRERLAERFTARGLPTTPEQILITSGALQAVRLALSLYVGAGDRVLVEQPGYPGGLDIVADLGARAVPVPVHDGLGRPGRRGPGDRGPADRSARGVPDPGLPEPDRRADAGRAAGRSSRRRSPRAGRRRSSTSRWSSCRSNPTGCQRLSPPGPAPSRWSPWGRRARSSGAACGSAGCARTR